MIPGFLNHQQYHIWDIFVCHVRWWQTQTCLSFSLYKIGRWTHFDEHIFSTCWFNHQRLPCFVPGCPWWRWYRLSPIVVLPSSWWNGTLLCVFFGWNFLFPVTWLIWLLFTNVFEKTRFWCILKWCPWVDWNIYTLKKGTKKPTDWYAHLLSRWNSRNINSGPTIWIQKNLRQFEVPGGIAFTSSIEESDHQKSIYSKSIPRVFDFGIQYYTVGAKMNRMVSTQPNLIQMISDGDLAEKDRKTR